MSNEREGLRQRLEQIEAEMARSDPRFVSKEVREIVELGRKVLSLLTQAQEPVGWWEIDPRSDRPWRDCNTINHDDALDGSDGGYDAHGNRIIPEAMREIVMLRHALYASPVASAPEEEREEALGVIETAVNIIEGGNYTVPDGWPDPVSAIKEAVRRIRGDA